MFVTKFRPAFRFLRNVTGVRVNCPLELSNQKILCPVTNLGTHRSIFTDEFLDFNNFVRVSRKVRLAMTDEVATLELFLTSVSDVPASY